jgi:hypothetical protein
MRDGIDFAERFGGELRKAFDGGKRCYKVPYGRYPLEPAGSGPHIKIEGLKRGDGDEFIIDLTGATFIGNDIYKGLLLIKDCENIIFRGGTLSYAAPTMTQGVVDKVGDGGLSIEITLDEGYPELLPEQRTPTC